MDGDWKKKVDFIKNIYGDSIENYTIDMDGYTSDVNRDFKHVERKRRTHNKWRPIELQGVEHNNGWNCIVSVNDLPKRSGNYHVVLKDRKENENWVLRDILFNSSMSDLWLNKYSHWKNIEKLEYPIY